jgi:predicted 3-demethylubiquinone-9 3-methyltransferase (glyoxalase superfamily)
MQKITPCLWFDNQAEEAASFYASVFKNSKVKGITHYGKAVAKAAGKPEGTVLTVVFELEGQEFMALNGGPQFPFSPAVSLMVNCRTQKQIDDLWAKLSADASAEQCGWLKDKFGVSWQIVPAVLGKMLMDKDSAKSERAMAALLRMKKLDLSALKEAYERGSSGRRRRV